MPSEFHNPQPIPKIAIATAVERLHASTVRGHQSGSEVALSEVALSYSAPSRITQRYSRHSNCGDTAGHPDTLFLRFFRFIAPRAILTLDLSLARAYYSLKTGARHHVSWFFLLLGLAATRGVRKGGRSLLGAW